MQQKIFDILLKEEEVGWKDILYELVESEQMQPWDVDVSLITQKYIQTIKEMQEHSLRVSGKVVLAAAFLLRMKSTHLIENDISRFDALIAQDDDDLIDEDFWQEFSGDPRLRKAASTFPLIPKNPQARNRKVSVQDLVKALERAMMSKRRVLQKIRPVPFKRTRSKIDIMEVIRDVYHKLEYYTKKEKTKTLPFKRLLPTKAGKEEKVFTFMPLLHLENQQKVVMEQKQAFSEIHVKKN